MKAILRKLVSRRARKIYLWGGICLVTFTVLFYQIANWRGAKAWKEARARLETEGELLTIGDLVPELPPASENFFATPALLDIAKVDDDGINSGPHAEKRRRLEEMKPHRRVEASKVSPPKGDPWTSTPTDFSKWVDYLNEAGTLDLSGIEAESPAATVLAALERANGPLFEELAAARNESSRSSAPTWKRKPRERCCSISRYHTTRVYRALEPP